SRRTGTERRFTTENTENGNRLQTQGRSGRRAGRRQNSWGVRTDASARTPKVLPLKFPAFSALNSLQRLLQFSVASVPSVVNRRLEPEIRAHAGFDAVRRPRR